MDITAIPLAELDPETPIYDSLGPEPVLRFSPPPPLSSQQKRALNAQQNKVMRIALRLSRVEAEEFTE